MTGLPKWWWDQILDGRAYEVDVRSTPYVGLGALRSACYREADLRQRLVATSKLSVLTLAIQAWGNPNVSQLSLQQPYFGPDMKLLAPPAVIASKPAPQDQPPSTVEPPEDEAEALLGPCTCGHDPKCLPSCERFS